MWLVFFFFPDKSHLKQKEKIYSPLYSPGFNYFHWGIIFRTNGSSPSLTLPHSSGILPGRKAAPMQQVSRTPAAPLKSNRARGAAFLPSTEPARPWKHQAGSSNLLLKNGNTFSDLSKYNCYGSSRNAFITRNSLVSVHWRKGMAYFRRIIYILLGDTLYSLIQRNRDILCNNEMQQKLLIKITP